MHAEKLVVIVCDTTEQFEEKYKKIDKQCDVLCLTKNINLILAGSETNKNVKIKILESQKCYRDYVEKTWDILDDINACIAQMTTERTYLYQMGYHLEGESEAMQVAEILMFEDMYDDFFKHYTNVQVYCYYNIIYAKEIEHLYFWCKINKMKLFLDFSKSKWELKKLRLFILSKFGEKLLDILVEGFAILQNKIKIIKLKKIIKYQNEKGLEQQYTDVGIIKGSASEKDFNWTKGYLDILNDAGIGFRFICVNEESKQRWENYGYKADNILRSLQNNVLNRELKNYKIVKKKIKNDLMKFLLNGESVYDSEQLRIIIKNFLHYKTVDSVISDVAANEFFKNHYYKIIDLHADTNSMLSKVCCFNAKKYSDIVKIRNCTGSLQLGKGLYYEPYGYLSDFGFVLNDMESCRSKVEKHRTENVGRKYEVKNITYSKEFYQNIFNTDLLKKDLCVLWAPSYPCIGNISYINFLQTGLNLIEFFRANSGKFIIKFHPHQREIETNVFKERSKENSNILIESSVVNIREVMDRVDILITNCSLSSIDAVIKRKAVICVVCEYEYQKIEWHKEGLCIIQNPDELIALLLQLEDETYRKQWIAERVSKQDAYFATLIGNADESVKISQIIKKELSY